MDRAQKRLFAAIQTFNEIMCGPNPLTRDEISNLYQKRPRWRFLKAWL